MSRRRDVSGPTATAAKNGPLATIRYRGSERIDQYRRPAREQIRALTCVTSAVRYGSSLAYIFIGVKSDLALSLVLPVAPGSTTTSSSRLGIRRIPPGFSHRAPFVASSSTRRPPASSTRAAGPTEVPAQPERPARRRCPPSAVGPGRAPIGYRRLPRTSSRWAVHSDVCPSFVDELPCQPHTQVTCCSRCTYWSITCLRGSSVAVAEDLGGLGFTDTLLGWLTARRGLRRGPPIVRHSRGFGRTRAYGSVRSIRMAATGWRVDPDRASASGGSSGARRPGR